jgi:hypothetical protein
MSFNLGEWWTQLTCELCSEYQPPLDLNLPSDYLDGQLPADFWDDPPDPPGDPFDFEVPDWYPYLEFPDGGLIFGIHGTF